jgi:hypothetical protein
MPQYMLRVTTPSGRLTRRIVFTAVNGREAEVIARELSGPEPSQLWCGGWVVASWGARAPKPRHRALPSFRDWSSAYPGAESHG